MLEPTHRITNARARLAGLSPREIEVARLIAVGALSKTIAYELGISIKTVEVHRERVMTKTACASLVEFGRLWEAGLVEAQDTVASSLPGFMIAVPAGEVAHA